MSTPSNGEAGGGALPHVLAFYLPQFHEVPENDAWHGHGFTEWSVVARSSPLFPGHRQPDLPGELGFYDLRVPETRSAQAHLAAEHGITGFLYYHYWFNGRRMLERPFQEILESGQPDFPFALCWANESWFRRWQGSNDEMLLEQTFSEEDDVAHIRWLIECFKDPRYIRINGRPLLTVYRALNLPDPAHTMELWRRECAQAGMEPPWLVMFETGDKDGDPGRLGFDASAEFVPHRIPYLLQATSEGTGSATFTTYDYDEVATAYAARPPEAWPRYPCVATGWDNAPRRQSGGALVLRNGTPESYGRWLGEAITGQMKTSGRDGIVFVNAWNEWAEGAHLEPDAFWGRAYLEVTRDVLRGLGADAFPEPPSVGSDQPATAVEDLYHELYEKFVALQQSSSGFLSYADRRLKEMQADYEAKLAEARHEAREIADLNEAMAEQLDFLLGRLKELGVTELPSLPWLATH
ncbi:MAG TPA: glycoside hydrolase family 99-like domain-containing protein [Acidimicrobiales bacterium]|jgi:hypothetical protein|nr:glycoside hydrolase family 99-like domain-containing protein [Acidimicrobiales bacterium]